MKALLMANRFSSGLEPLTDNLPDSMMPIMAKPLLERNIIKLRNSGIKEIIISKSLEPNPIEEYFGDGSRLGVKIQYICEAVPTGTGSTIKNTEGFLTDTFIVFNSSILSNIDILDLYEFHKQKSAPVTIAATEVKNAPSSSYSKLKYDENGYVKSFIQESDNTSSKPCYINAGIYILEPHVLKELEPGKDVSMEKEAFPMLLEKDYPIAVYKNDEYWMDIRTIENYNKVHEDILNGVFTLPEYNAENQDIYTGENTQIHPSVKIVGPVYIGKNANIGAYSTIGPNVVIGNNCKVGINSSVKNSIVGNNLHIQTASTVSNIMLTLDCALRKN